MKIKTIFTLTCVLSSIAGGSYLAYNYAKSEYQERYTQSLSNYKSKIKRSEDKIQAILKSLPSEFYIMKGRAEEALGGGKDAEKMLKIFALNGTNECASSANHSTKFRCTEAEEAAVMYSVLNRFKSGKYKTLKDVIFEKNQYSWTLAGLQTADMESESFYNSVKIASYILSGSDKYDAYNFGQTHYCKSYYIKVDKQGNKHILNGCGWHNSSSKLIPLGRMHIKDADVPKTRILDSELSFHNFYKLRG